MYKLVAAGLLSVGVPPPGVLSKVPRVTRPISVSPVNVAVFAQ